MGWEVNEASPESYFVSGRSLKMRMLGRITRPFSVNLYNDYILEMVKSTGAKYFLAVKGNYIKQSTLRKLSEDGVITVNYFPDFRFGYSSVDQLTFPEYRLFITTKSFQVEPLRKQLGENNVAFVHHGYCSDVHYPPDISQLDLADIPDVLYVGTYTKHKEVLFSALMRSIPELKFQIYGNGWSKASDPVLKSCVAGRPVYGLNYAQLVNAAKINLAVHMGVADNSGWQDLVSTRSFEIPACKGFMLHVDNDEIRQLYSVGEEIDVFSSPEELSQKIRYYLKHESIRKDMVDRAYGRCVPAYSYDHRAVEIATLMGSIRRPSEESIKKEPVSEKKYRVAIVVSHPIQHFVHLYKALARHPHIELKVFFASSIGVKPYYDQQMAVEIQWAMDLLGGYDHEFLPEADSITMAGFKEINNPSIVPALRRFAPDVVQLHGYAQLTLLRALLWCTFKRIPVLLWSDSSLLFQRPGWKTKLKETLLPWLLKLFSGVLSTGDNNAEYYRHYGIKPDRIFYCPFTIDKIELESARVNQVVHRQTLRQKYGIAPDEYVLLYVGKLVLWKRPIDFLDAVKAAQVRVPENVRLVAFFAGDGSLRKDLEAHRDQHVIRAIFGGFINVDILPSIYAMADALVFPSDREPYGLSAREAICVGLPLIVSDQIGCVGSTDAARPGLNALLFPSRNVPALTDCIVRLSADTALQQSMSQASLNITQEMDETISVNGFVRGVKEVLGLPHNLNV